MLTRERMRELIEQHGLSDRADEIMAEVRPSIHLTLRYDVEEADIPIGASKMGGSPDVPEGFEFPKWNFQYLSFIAQIRLSDAKPFDLEDLLPETGMLYFFYENNQYIEHIHQMQDHPTGPYCVVYVPDETGLRRIPHPISQYRSISVYYYKIETVETEVYQTCPIVFEQEWTPLSEGQPGSRQRPLPFPSTEHDRYWGHDSWWSAVEHELAEPMHRLLGVETDIQFQYSMMNDASKAWNLGTGDDWILLLQVDSQVFERNYHKPGFEWGDNGVIYYCIHKDDLRARRFDRVWLHFDSYTVIKRHEKCRSTKLS